MIYSVGNTVLHALGVELNSDGVDTRLPIAITLLYNLVGASSFMITQ